MHNYLLTDLDSKWNLVRETPYSQKFIVEADGMQGLTAMFDIHYTKPEIVYVNVCFVGPKLQFTDSVCSWLFYDLEKIVKRHGSYSVIDYSLVYSEALSHGNFAIM